jgi:hypothetical protein
LLLSALVVSALVESQCKMAARYRPSITVLAW